MTTLAAPSGIEIYGGVGAFTSRSADGSMYVVYCGERPNRKFGTHIYRILPNNVTEWVEYAPFTESRVECSVEPDGLYISYGAGDPARKPERIKVAGYVTPPFPGGTHTLPPSPVTVNGTDQTARDMATSAKTEARERDAQIKRDLEKKIAELAAKVAAPSSGGVDLQTMRDHIWTLTLDRVYHELTTNPNGPLANVIRNLK